MNPINRSKPVNVYLRDKRFGGWWEVEGSDVLVSSAYGSGRRRINARSDPEKVAASVLTELVEDYLRT